MVCHGVRLPAEARWGDRGADMVELAVLEVAPAHLVSLADQLQLLLPGQPGVVP